jgi:hypothetical protein
MDIIPGTSFPRNLSPRPTNYRCLGLIRRPNTHVLKYFQTREAFGNTLTAISLQLAFNTCVTKFVRELPRPLVESR